MRLLIPVPSIKITDPLANYSQQYEILQQNVSFKFPNKFN